MIQFCNPASENGYLSSLYLSDFAVEEREYCCAEQYIAYQKAMCFLNYDLAKQIMQSVDPNEIHILGRSVKNFHKDTWSAVRYDLCIVGLYAKFSQNGELRDALLETGDELLVYCSPSDKDWGIGLAVGHPDVERVEKWPGSNILGGFLMRVRKMLREGESTARRFLDETEYKPFS